MPKFGSNLKTISFLLIQALLFEQFAFAAPELFKPTRLEISQKPRVSLNLPESEAVIEDAYKAGESTIYLIQDAHTNDSGQINLAKTLDRIFSQEKDIRYIFTEGAVADNSLSDLRASKPLAERQTVAMSYIRKGLLHGAEYFNLTSDHDAVIWGVEDPSLYKQALEDYKAVARDRVHFQDYLSRIDATIGTLKPRVLNPALLDFDAKHEKFNKETISLTDYFGILTRQTEKLRISLDAYPHLTKLDDLQKKEASIDFKKATEEQAKALESLTGAEQDELVAAAQENKNSPFKLSGSDQKEKKAFYALLEEKLGLKAYAQYPELSKYFQYLKAAKTLDVKELLKEVKSLDAAVYKKLTKTEDERTLIRASHTAHLLNKLLLLTLTPEEYGEYRELTKDFNITAMTGFLNKKIMDLKTYYERVVFLEEGYEDIVSRSEGFYELTIARDRNFVQESLAKMVRDNQTKAILIAGGFHSRNLKSLFKESGISYVSIMPQVLNETNQKRYESILMSQTMAVTPSATLKAGVSTIMTTYAKADGTVMPYTLVDGRPLGEALTTDLGSPYYALAGARLAGLMANLRKVETYLDKGVYDELVDEAKKLENDLAVAKSPENFQQLEADLNEFDTRLVENLRDEALKLFTTEEEMNGYESNKIGLMRKTNLPKELADKFKIRTVSDISTFDQAVAVIKAGIAKKRSVLSERITGEKKKVAASGARLSQDLKNEAVQLKTIADATQSAEEEKDRWSQTDAQIISTNVQDWLSAGDDIVPSDYKAAIRKLLDTQDAAKLKNGFLNKDGIIWPGTAGFRGPMENIKEGMIGPNYIGVVLMRQYADIYRSLFTDMAARGQLSNNPYAYGVGEVRLNTEHYGETLSLGMAAAGVKVIRFFKPTQKPLSTPMASHAAQYFAAQFGYSPEAGYTISGSHNGLKDSGVKAFNGKGAQLLPDEVAKLKPFKKKTLKEIAPFPSEDELKARGLLVEMTAGEYEGLLNSYFDAIESTLPPTYKADILKAAANGMRFVFTPINGSTKEETERFLEERIGLKKGVHFLVPEDEAVLPQNDPQHEAWGYKDFDPARKGILNKTVQFAEANGIDTIYARDLDGDRLVMGIRKADGTWVYLDGNQNAILMLQDKLASLKAEGLQDDINNFVMMRTHVTSPLLDAIAKSYGVKEKNIGVVAVGFKYFGAVIMRVLGKWGRRYFGAEESYGTSNGVDPEKDSLTGFANMLLIAAKAHEEKQNAYDRLIKIYEVFGYSGDITTKVDIPGAGPAEQNANKAKSLAALKDLKVGSVIEGRYKVTGVSHEFEAPLYSTEKLTDGFRFTPLEDIRTGKKIDMIVRASGTEPVFKHYFFWAEPIKPAVGQDVKDVIAETQRYLENDFAPTISAFFQHSWSSGARLSTTAPARRVAPFDTMTEEEMQRAGGKGANLGRLRAKNVPAPDGFTVLAEGFQDTLDHNGLHDKIGQILDGINVDNAVELQAAADEIQRLIKEATLPPDLEATIMNEHAALAERLGLDKDKMRTAVRSSALSEDKDLTPEMKQALGDGLTSGSSAGQQTTYLNVSRGAVIRRTLDDFASLFNGNAISYRDTQGLVDFIVALRTSGRFDAVVKQLLANPETRDAGQALSEKRPIARALLRPALQKAAPEFLAEYDTAYDPYLNPRKLSLAAVIQHMIRSDRAFTIFSLDSRTGWTGYTFQKDKNKPTPRSGRVFRLDTNYGLGESVVQGIVNPDTFLIHIFTDENGVQHVNILEKTIGTKKLQVIYIENALDELGLTDAEAMEITAAAQGKSDLSAALKTKLKLRDNQVQEFLNTLSSLKSLDYDGVDAYTLPEGLANIGFSALKTIRLAHLVKARAEDPNIQTMETYVAAELRDKFSTTDEEVRKIALMAKKATDFYDDVRDMEGGIEKSVMGLVQSRSITQPNIDVNNPEKLQLRKRVTNEDAAKQAEKDGKLMAVGVPGRNAVTGEIFVLDKDSHDVPYDVQLKKAQDRARELEKEDKTLILVTKFTTPQDEPAMKVSGGVVAMEGGDTSHAAIVSRELGIATVVGISEYLEKLKGSDRGAYERMVEYLHTPGNVITVDANEAKVYMGELPIETQIVEIDTTRLPDLGDTKLGLIAANPRAMQEISKIANYDSYYGVSLARAEFILVGIGVHPRAIEAFDNLMLLEREPKTRLSERELADVEILRRSPKLIEVIRDKCRGYASAKEFYTDKMYQGIAMMAAANGKKQKVLYRFNDFKQNELNKIAGGPEFGLIEEASMIGDRGSGWLLKNENSTALGMEMEALRRAYENGYTNVGAFFAFVRTPDELSRGLDRMTKLNMPLDTVGMMVELPSNVIQAEEYAKRLAEYAKAQKKKVFFSFGTNDLTQLTRVAGREEPGVKELFAERNPSVIGSIFHVIDVSKQAAQKYGVDFTCGLCGQALVKLLDSDPEIAEEIITELDSGGLDILSFMKAVRAAARARLNRYTLRDQDVAATQTPIAIGRALDSQGAASRKVVVVRKFDDIKNVDLGSFMVIDPSFTLDVNADIPRVNRDNLITVLDRVDRDSFNGELKAVAKAIRAKLKAGENNMDWLLSGPAFREEVARFLILEAIDQAGAVVLQAAGENKEIVIKINPGSGAVSNDLYKGLKGIKPRISLTPQGLSAIAAQNGNIATIDFAKGRVFAGAMTLTKRPRERKGIIHIPAQDPKVNELQAEYISAHAIYESMEQHPLAIPSTKREARFKRYIRNAIEAALASKKNGKKVVYQTNDMNSSHYRKMKDGREFAVGEENPPLGLGGLYRYLKTDSQYRELLKWEFEVLAEYREEVAVELTDVRDLEHLDRALALMKEAGLKPGENGFELGMRMDNPDNYIFAGEYINRGHLAFVHTDAQRLSQTYLAADRNNQHVPVDDIVVEANLKLPIRMIAQAAAEAGIPMAKTEPIHPAIKQLTQEIRSTGFQGVNYFLVDGYRVNASIVQKQGHTPEQIAHALAEELAKRGGVDARFNKFYGLNPNWTYSIQRSEVPGRTDELIINHVENAGSRLASVAAAPEKEVEPVKTTPNIRLEAREDRVVVLVDNKVTDQIFISDDPSGKLGQAMAYAANQPIRSYEIIPGDFGDAIRLTFDDQFVILNRIGSTSIPKAGARLAGKKNHQGLAASFKKKAELLLVAASQVPDTGSAVTELGKLIAALEAFNTKQELAPVDFIDLNTALNNQTSIGYLLDELTYGPSAKADHKIAASAYSKANDELRKALGSRLASTVANIEKPQAIKTTSTPKPAPQRPAATAQQPVTQQAVRPVLVPVGSRLAANRLNAANFVDVIPPADFAPALHRNPYNLTPTRVQVLPLNDAADSNIDVLKNRLVAFAAGSSAAQALGSILYAGKGKSVKEVADGNAVHFSQRSIEAFINANPNIAIVVLADEGSRDDSFSLQLGKIFHKEGEIIKEIDFTGIQSLKSRLAELRAANKEILYFVGDALEHTNGLIVPEAATTATNSSSLFAFYIGGENRYLINDNFRIGGFSGFVPSGVDAGITPYDLPSQALDKLAAVIPGFDKTKTRLLTLGPRAADLEKDAAKAASTHRHAAIMEDAKQTGADTIFPGDGDALARVVATLGLDLDGNQLFVFGRSGAAEATAAGIVAANTPGAQFPHTFASEKATAGNYSAATAHQFTETDLGNFEDLDIPAGFYNSNRTKADIQGNGIVAITSVTGAPEKMFGESFADIFRRVTFDSADKTVVTNTLISTPEGAFIIRTTFVSPDLEATKEGLLQASHAAREYRDQQAAKPAGARLIASSIPLEEPTRNFLSRGVGPILREGVLERLALAEESGIKVFNLKKDDNRLLVQQGEESFVLDVSTGALTEARRKDAKNAVFNRSLTDDAAKLIAANAASPVAKGGTPAVYLIHLDSFTDATSPKSELENLIIQTNSRLSDSSIVAFVGTEAQTQQALALVARMGLKNADQFTSQDEIASGFKGAPHILLIKQGYTAGDNVGYDRKITLQKNSDQTGVFAFGAIQSLMELVAEGNIEAAHEKFLSLVPQYRGKFTIEQFLDYLNGDSDAIEKFPLLPTIWASLQDAVKLYQLSRTVAYSA